RADDRLLLRRAPQPLKDLLRWRDRATGRVDADDDRAEVVSLLKLAELAQEIGRIADDTDEIENTHLLAGSGHDFLALLCRALKAGRTRAAHPHPEDQGQDHVAHRRRSGLLRARSVDPRIHAAGTIASIFQAVPSS